MKFFQQLKFWIKKFFRRFVQEKKSKNNRNLSGKDKENKKYTTGRHISKNIETREENDQEKLIYEQVKKDTIDSTQKIDLLNNESSLSEEENNPNNAVSIVDIENQEHLPMIPNVVKIEDNVLNKNLMVAKPYKRQDIDEIKEKEDKKQFEKIISSPKTNIGTINKKQINIGEKRNYKRRVIKSSSKVKIISNEDKTNKQEAEKKKNIIFKPYIEFDLNRQKIYLVFPEQQISDNSFPTEDLNYKLQINSLEKNISITTSKKDNYLLIRSKKILIEEPIENLNIKFPPLFNFEEMEYLHRSKNIYIFTSYGKTKFKMHYLYDNTGGMNVLPRKDIWVLLKEDCDLISTPSNLAEIWIWESYNPAFFKLKEKNELFFQDSTGIFQEIPYESNFILEGTIIKDGLFEESPMFIGNSAKLNSKYANPQGWKIWIQTKQSGHDRLISKNWTGDEPLEILFVDSLPCEFGEFQLSICNQNNRIPVDIIFFRYIKSISLIYDDSLVLPSAMGHIDEKIEVLFNDNSQNWKIISQDITEKIEKGYRLIIKDKDSVDFNIANINNPRIRLPIRINISKLLWKLSETKEFSDKEIDLNRDKIIIKQNLLLNVYINTDINYEVETTLLQDGKELQTIKLKKNKGIYNCLLGKFSDTISSTNSTLVLLLKFYENKEFIAEIKVLKILFKDIICKLCDNSKSFTEMNDFHTHFFLQHWGEAVKTLQYDEIRNDNPSLPAAIFKCLLCEQFIKIQNLENSTGYIEYHIKNICNFAKNRPKDFPIEKCYIKITDMETIRESVYPKLMKLYKCKLCSKVPKDRDSKISNFKAMLHHFYDYHQKEYFYYK